MKKFTILLLLLISSTFAQKSIFSDAPFGIGIGFKAAWIMPDYEGINDMLKVNGFEEFETSGFYGLGGGGFVYINVINNLRVGFTGIGGNTTSDKELNNWQTHTEYSTNMMGVSFEYTLPFIRKVGISLGAIVGWGNTTIKIYQSSTSPIWQDVFDPTSVNTIDFHREITNDYFIVAPTVNIDIPIHRLVAIRFGGGYSLPMSDDTWKIYYDREIQNVPDDVKNNNMFIEVGIMVGFFAF